MASVITANTIKASRSNTSCISYHYHKDITRFGLFPYGSAWLYQSFSLLKLRLSLSIFEELHLKYLQGLEKRNQYRRGFQRYQR